MHQRVIDRDVLRRWRSGFGANLYGQFVTAFIQIVGIPILLHSWGPRLYGEWLILTAIPAYLSVTDLGFSQSAANDMTQRVARNDYTGALAVFQSLEAMVLGLLVAVLVLALTLLSILPLGRWMHFEVLSTHEVRWVLAFLVIEVLVRLAEGVCHAGYRATGDYALHVRIYFSTLLAQMVSVWVVALLGGGVVSAAAAILTVRTVVTPVVGWLLVHRHPWLSFGFSKAARRHLRGLLRPAFANVSMPLAQAFSIQGLVLAVGATLGPLAVVTFSTLRTLTRLALQAVLTTSSAAEPELAAAFGTRSMPLLRALYAHAIRAGFWLATSATILLLVAGGPIVRLWTNGRVSMDPALFHWFLLSAILSVLWYGSLTVLKAANVHLTATLVYVSAAASTVAIAGLLVHATHTLFLAGAALVLTDLAMILYCLPAAARLVNAPPFKVLWLAVNPVPLIDAFRSPGHAG